MKNTLRLALTIIKGNGLANFGSDASGRKKKLSATMNAILMAFFALYMLGIMTASALALRGFLASAGLQSLIVSLYLNLGVIIVFIFGLMMVISVFYHSSDVEKILPLPLRADQVIGAKLLVSAIYEYMFFIVLALPALIIYGVFEGRGAAYYVFTAVVILVMPAVPLCMASILVMVVMRFTKFARNKDRFSMVSSILIMVFALAFSMSMQMAASITSADLSNIITSGEARIAQITSVAFPGTPWAAAALVGPQDGAALVKLVLFLLVSAVAVAVTLLAGRLLYFKGVIGLSTAVSNRRRLSGSELAEAGKSGSPFWTYVLKDFRILVRTPVFFLNNVLFNFIFPVFLLVPLMTKENGASALDQIRSLSGQLFSSGSSLSSIALAVGFGVVSFVTGTNGVAESAPSREGKIFYFMKFLPMSYTKQVWAKLTVGIILSLCGSLIMIIFTAVLIQPPAWFILLLLLMLPGAILIPNLSGIIFELFWPKLNWDNEAKAVKTNMNVLYGIILSVLMTGLVIAPVIALRMAMLPSAIYICGMPLVLALILALVVRRIAPRRMLAIDV